MTRQFAIRRSNSQAIGTGGLRVARTMLAFAPLLLAGVAGAQPVLITAPQTIAPTATVITPTGGGPAVPLATARITVRAATLTVNGRHAVASLALENGAVVRHDANTTFDYSANGSDIVKGLALNVAGDVVIPAGTSINASFMGYPGHTGPGAGTLGGGPCGGAGAGHGGPGGHGNCADRPGGPAYGSLTQPSDFGSGGSFYPGFGLGSPGGGCVRLIVGGALSLDGSILADGDSVVNCGGGAGGSIWITANSIVGSGLISARGGNQGTSNESGGGGAGGRIVVNDQCGPGYGITMLAPGGAAGGPDNRPGAPGTIQTSSGRASIQGSPSNALTCPGGGVTIAVQALGNGLSYQWRRSGTSLADEPNHISGATSPTLTLANVIGADAGAYDCVVSNACNDVTSTAALLRVCIADIDDGSGQGVCDGGVTIDDLLYYISIFGLGVTRADLDDGSATGTPDGGVTIDDLLYFLTRFADGC